MLPVCLVRANVHNLHKGTGTHSGLAVMPDDIGTPIRKKKKKKTHEHQSKDMLRSIHHTHTLSHKRHFP